jgi:hypothetical protein
MSAEPALVWLLIDSGWPWRNLPSFRGFYIFAKRISERDQKGNKMEQGCIWDPIGLTDNKGAFPFTVYALKVIPVSCLLSPVSRVFAVMSCLYQFT